MKGNFITQDEADETCRDIERAIGGVLVESDHSGHVQLHFPDSCVINFEILIDEYYEPYLTVNILQ